MEQKFEEGELSSLEEKVDLENLVLYPSEFDISERIDEDNFRIKDEPLENEIIYDISETAIPNHKYEKSPIETSTNNKEDKIKDVHKEIVDMKEEPRCKTLKEEFGETRGDFSDFGIRDWIILGG